MKKLTILTLSFCLFLATNFYAQFTIEAISSATANCSQFFGGFTITSGRGPSVFPTESVTLNGCSVVTNSFTKATFRTFLQKKNNSGVFEDIAGPIIDGMNYSNLSHGTYKLRAELPILHLCGNNEWVRVFNSNFEVQGDFSSGWRKADISGFDPEVVVGATEPADLQLLWHDDDMHPIYDSWLGFDLNEAVNIDMSQSKNYNQHSLAITEFFRPPNGDMIPTGRWRAFGSNPSGGWVNGTAGIVNIKSSIWENTGDPWTFLTVPNYTYRLQVVIRNSNCPSYIDAYPDFLICPNGWNCRLGKDDLKKWVIAPNPVSTQFSIQNLDLSQFKTDKLNLKIHDLTGREVKTYNQVVSNEFNVSDLSSGVYIVSVFVDKTKLHTSKLVISK